MPARERDERRAHAHHALSTHEDAWVATASPEGKPHLVPLSIVYDGDVVTIATVAHGATARNVTATGRARLALGGLRDVVLVDATVTAVPWARADPTATAAFVAARGWDPAAEPHGFVLLTCAPTRVLVWRSVEELTGREVMRDGAWLDADD